jgi:hypothetical protein
MMSKGTHTQAESANAAPASVQEKTRPFWMAIPAVIWNRIKAIPAIIWNWIKAADKRVYEFTNVSLKTLVICTLIGAFFVQYEVGRQAGAKAACSSSAVGQGAERSPRRTPIR